MIDFSAKWDGKWFRKCSLALCVFDHHGWSIDFFGKFIPLKIRHPGREIEIMESWGFGLLDRSVHLNWGSKYKIIRFPWDWEHLKNEVLRPDGTWVPFVGSWERGEEPDGRQEWEFDYKYVLNSGEVQHRKAAVHVERREWRWRWLMWSPWPSLKRQSIDVEFSDEVGERTGSWKGGCVGCGYDMLPGETAEQTLRRMERERKFR